MGEYNHEQGVKKMLYAAGILVIITLTLLIIQL